MGRAREKQREREMGRAREVKRQRQRAREGEKKADAEEEPTAYVPAHTQLLLPHYQLAKFHY